MAPRAISSLVLTAVSLVLGAPAHASTISILTDGGFEAAANQSLQLTWTASDYGSWGVGDGFSTVTGAGSIAPLGGSKMLAFDSTDGLSSDVYQIVDISGYAAQIDAGLVSATFSIFYNATSSPSGGFGLRIIGWASAPTDFSGVTALGGVVSGLAIDSDASTWEQFAFSNVLVPTGTRFVALGLHEPTGAPIGYADNATLSLNIVPEPATVLLVAAGLAAVRGRRRLGRA